LRHPCVAMAVTSKMSTRYKDGRKERGGDAVMLTLWRESCVVTLSSVIPRHYQVVLGPLFAMGMRAPHCVPIRLPSECPHIAKEYGLI